MPVFCSNIFVPQDVIDKWNKGAEKFVLQKEDNPDNIQFYKAWYSIREILGNEFVEKYNGFCHNSLCMGGSENPKYFFSNFINFAKQIPIDPKPIKHYGWWCVKPNDNIEERAKEMFNRQFKEKFVGKRLNSKFAKEKWDEVKDKAIEFAKQNYETELAKYEKQVAEVDAEYQKKLDEWNDKCLNKQTILDKIKELGIRRPE